MVEVWLCSVISLLYAINKDETGIIPSSCSVKELSSLSSELGVGVSCGSSSAL